MSLGQAYLKAVTQRFMEAKLTTEKAIEQLSESELFWTPDEESNSIAIIIWFLDGLNFLHQMGKKRIVIGMMNL